MSILFESGFENGTFTDFDSVSCSGVVDYRAQKGIKRSGLYAAKLSVAPMLFAARPGVRLTWANKRGCAADDPANLPDDATYAAWYYLPKPLTTSSNNIMQWKQGLVEGGPTDPAWNVQLKTVAGVLRFVLRDRVDEAGEYDKVGVTGAMSAKSVPIAEWFLLATNFVWSRSGAGRVASWLNGELLWDVQDTATEFDRPFLPYPRRVAWNNYAGDVRPWPYSLFIDDVSVWTE